MNPTQPTLEAKYSISGHETFPCRYTWLPKAVRHLREAPDLFSDEDDAMVRLGVGKNMVRSIRFWADAAGVIQKPKPASLNGDLSGSSRQPMLLEKPKADYRTGRRTSNGGGDWVASEFGNAVFGLNGYDQYLEDIKTLWLIHW